MEGKSAAARAVIHVQELTERLATAPLVPTAVDSREPNVVVGMCQEPLPGRLGESGRSREAEPAGLVAPTFSTEEPENVALLCPQTPTSSSTWWRL
jgi:hypothetical protein